jgi:hypothetical protein
MRKRVWQHTLTKNKPAVFFSGNSNKVGKGPQTSHAATTIQKNWRGHSARTNDDRVQELKDEVKKLFLMAGHFFRIEINFPCKYNGLVFDVDLAQDCKEKVKRAAFVLKARPFSS